MMHYVYIIESLQDDTFYKGYTTDYLKRLEEHNSGLSEYTSRKTPLAMSNFAIFRQFCNFDTKPSCMNISFTDKQEKYIANQLISGDFQNASEVVRDALRLHELFRARVLEELRKEIKKGWDSPPSKRTVKEIIKAKANKIGWLTLVM